MGHDATERLRTSIAGKVRQLRIERRWTQTDLAELLGLSQNRLSEIERGRGSFTAEQLLVVLKTFNVPVDYFAQVKASAESQLQNALARLGGSHLHESPEVLPTEALREVNEVILQTLVGMESPRQTAALAPVIAANINKINLSKLRADLRQAGVERRLGWVLENTLEALRQEEGLALSREWRVRYKRAEIVLANFLAPWLQERGDSAGIFSEEILDHGIASQATLEGVRASSSAISKAWRIVTRLQTDDFAHALRQARGAD
ncbi:MAG: hypothetical protein A2040_08930 [Rhodocyclales bacterium GWA2_65_19]|nr:MAG: hypothetical protein A2040_08930 [Rhodocyclales bacterium GWA2_65_19]